VYEVLTTERPEVTPPHERKGYLYSPKLTGYGFIYPCLVHTTLQTSIGPIDRYVT